MCNLIMRKKPAMNIGHILGQYISIPVYRLLSTVLLDVSLWCAAEKGGGVLVIRRIG